MTQQITDCTEFLTKAKAALTEVESLKSEEERLVTEEATTRAAVEAEQKALKDEIDSTLRKRVQEINSSYDSEIAKSKEELKKAKLRREKAKNAGIEERIREDTKMYLEDTTQKMTELKDAFKKQHIPGYYTSRLYYALHFPRKPVDFLVILLFVAICFLALPCGIYFLALPEKYRMPLVLVGIYFAAILIFGGIYTYIGNASKSKHLDMLKLGRETWDDVAKNKKLVRKVTRQIRRDKSEDRYDLASYDDEISRIMQKISETTNQKQEALNNFDTVTKNIISDELTQNRSQKLGALISAHDEASQKLKTVGEERQQKRLALNDQYEVYLGKEFMSEEKIDALTEIVSRGSVLSLTDAMAEYRSAAAEKKE